MYRFFNTQTGTHFYTTAEAEKDSIIENLLTPLTIAAYWVDPGNWGSVFIFSFLILDAQFGQDSKPHNLHDKWLSGLHFQKLKWRFYLKRISLFKIRQFSI